MNGICDPQVHVFGNAQMNAFGVPQLIVFGEPQMNVLWGSPNGPKETILSEKMPIKYDQILSRSSTIRPQELIQLFNRFKFQRLDRNVIPNQPYFDFKANVGTDVIFES